MTMLDVDAVKIRKWAETGDRIDPDDATLTPALDRAMGWPDSFSDPQGDTPRRQVFNQLLAEVTAGVLEVIQHGGMLPWDSRITYSHVAHVTGSDGRIYRSVQGSLNEDPVTDASNTYWVVVIDTVSGTIAPGAIPNASETAAGVSEWANQAEMNSGDAARVARPSVIRTWIANTATFAASRVSGVLGIGNIPDIGAGKVTSGQFAVDRIPSLPASKTGSGNFDFARMPAQVRRIYVSTSLPDPADWEPGDIWIVREA